MLTELCQELNNWFDYGDRHFGHFEIKDGKLDVDYIQVGQYFRIIGSIFNDGVWRYGLPELSDEEFDGAVWVMAVPPAVVSLADEIEAYQKSDEAKPKIYQSESFGGYSYTLVGGYGSGGNVDGNINDWQNVFAKKLNKWRKM